MLAFNNNLDVDYTTFSMPEKSLLLPTSSLPSVLKYTQTILTSETNDIPFLHIFPIQYRRVWLSAAYAERASRSMNEVERKKRKERKRRKLYGPMSRR